jgi:hypothetical protein
MDLLNKEISDLNKDDISRIIREKVPESINLEFKRKVYGNKDADKKELLKDITSFANTNGGLLIIGVDEIEGCADKFCFFSGNADEEIQRMNSVIESSTEPRVSNIEIRALEVDKDKSVLIVKIPKSWNSPHRTNYKGSKRFYKRNSAGVYEADILELKKMFNISFEREVLLRNSNNKFIEQIKKSQTPVTLRTDTNGILLLQIVPIQSIEKLSQIELSERDLRVELLPMNVNSWEGRYNVDGYVSYGTQNLTFTQLHRNGIIEAATSSLSRNINQQKKIIPGVSILVGLLQSTTKYLNLLQNIGVQTPIRIFVSLLDVRDCRFALVNDPYGFRDTESYKFARDDIFLPAIDLMEFGPKFHYYETMRPVLDALWNADGIEKCDYFNDNGKWVGQKDVRELGLAP